MVLRLKTKMDWPVLMPFCNVGEVLSRRMLGLNCAWQENVFGAVFRSSEGTQSFVSYSVTLTPSLKHCMKYIKERKCSNRDTLNAV